jgi:hypothetical protein
MRLPRKPSPPRLVSIRRSFPLKNDLFSGSGSAPITALWEEWSRAQKQERLSTGRPMPSAWRPKRLPTAIPPLEGSTDASAFASALRRQSLLPPTRWPAYSIVCGRPDSPISTRERTSMRIVTKSGCSEILPRGHGNLGILQYSSQSSSRLLRR